ncbi:hypothetical protein Patl1_15843 [Pistacia atlantica]|uniref:Uncharacterized protein n=1 Tax=Pistacia atlantica TaxID=434234 RepID=A0ACC1B8S1_9ROSI|nr:hypothetical protein Patl1_15843 [Pistacia atlantica]
MKHQIPNLVKNGFYKEALYLYAQHHSASLPPHNFTFPPLLKVCAKLQSPIQGRILHTHLIKTGFSVDVYSATALGDMYMKLNLLGDALKAFDEMPQRNLASLNAVISGYSQNGYSREDFKKMQLAGEVPSSKCVTSLLSACADMAALKCGKEIHGHFIRTDIGDDDFLCTALIFMYMKCGFPSAARRVFDQIKIKPDDPAFWNAMVSGYGRNGEFESAVEIFDLMQEEKVKPNSATFVSILSACSHTGQVEKGLQVFRMMSDDYGIKPKSRACWLSN